MDKQAIRRNTAANKSNSVAEKLAAKFQAEHNLVETILENAEANLAFLDRDFNFIKVNSAFAEAAGYRKKDLVGKNLFQLYPNQKLQKTFKSVYHSGQKITYHRFPYYSVSHPKEVAAYYDWTLVPVKSGGVTHGLVISCIDVSEDVKSDQERERLMIQLRHEQERASQMAIEAEKHASELDAVFMALADPVLIYDHRGVLVSINPAALTKLGYDLIGKRFFEVTKILKLRSLDEKPVPRSQLLFTAIFKGKNISDATQLISTSSGETIAIITNASPVLSDNKVAGVVITMHDVTERLKLEQQKDEFIAIASHELKTPITTLKALTQILEQQHSSQPGTKDTHYLNKIDKHLDQLSSLVNNLLDVSRMESHNLGLRRRNFHFDGFLQEVVEDFQQAEPSHVIEIKNSYHGIVYADKNRLSQVLINLLTNAVKYSPQTNRVIIKTAHSPYSLTIGVKDFGVGIPRRLKSKIFDRFFRIKGPGGERFPGLGLGLYIANEIVKLHGGKMWVRSREKQGSTFFFSLPRRLSENEK